MLEPKSHSQIETLNLTPQKEETDEIARKRLEKNLLVRFQAALYQMQEGKLNVGISSMLELLETEELSNVTFLNPDYEKLKAAIHINLYKGYAELKESRKSFYYAAKYLDYQKDNYALAYEFGSALLREGFIGAGVVYLRRALSFAMVRGQQSFAQVILHKLVFALSLGDGPDALRKVLTELGKHRAFKGLSMDIFWQQYYTLLMVLNDSSHFNGKFNEELAEWATPARKVTQADIEKLVRARRTLQAKSAALKKESLTAASGDDVLDSNDEPEVDEIQEVMSHRIPGRSFTMNEVLKRINRQIEGFFKPETFRAQNCGSESKNPVDANDTISKVFYDHFLNVKLRFECESKRSKDSAFVAEGSVPVSLYDVIKDRYSIESRKSLSYMTTLLNELNYNFYEHFKNTIPHSHQLISNSPANAISAIKVSYYDGIIQSFNEQTTLQILRQFINENFSEKRRELKSGSHKFSFYGPNLFLLEDFQISMKEVNSFFSLLFEHFESYLEFDSFLVFNELLLRFSTINEVKNNLMAFQRYVLLLQTMFDGLNNDYFERKAAEYLLCSQKGGFEFPLLKENQRHELSTIYEEGMEIEEVCAEVERNDNMETEEDGLGKLEDFKEGSKFAHWPERFRESYEKRIETLFDVLHSEDLAADLLRFQTGSSDGLVRWNIAGPCSYWLQKKQISLGVDAFSRLLKQLSDDCSYQDLEIITTFVRFDLSKVNEEQANFAAPWSIAEALLVFLNRFALYQTFTDSKQAEIAFESTLAFIQANETFALIFQFVKTGKQENVERMFQNTNFITEAHKLVTILLPLNDKGACGNLLQTLVRIILNVYWRCKEEQKYIIFYQFLTAYKESTARENASKEYAQKPNNPPSEMLFSIAKRIKLLKCLSIYFQRFELQPDGPAQREQHVQLAMFIKEAERIFDFFYGLKFSIGTIHNFFLEKTGVREVSVIDECLNFYKCPPAKSKTQNQSISQYEDESHLHSNYHGKLLVEHLLLFKVYFDMSDALHSIDDFLFNYSDKSERFGDSKMFENQNTLVLPLYDVCIPIVYMQKMRRILRNFEKLPDVFSTFSVVLKIESLRNVAILGGPWNTFEEALLNINFEQNDHLYLFLLLLARYQESNLIEPPQKFSEEVKPANYKSLLDLYTFLKHRNPFTEADSLRLKTFLADSVSRMQLISNLYSSTYDVYCTQQVSEGSITTDTMENLCIEAMVHIYKLHNEILLAYQLQKLFPYLVSDGEVNQMVEKYNSRIIFLKENNEFVFIKGTKRIDYLLLFYVPWMNCLIDWNEKSYLHRVEKFLDADISVSLQTYHLNFKPGTDQKTFEKAGLIKVLILTKMLSVIYEQLAGNGELSTFEDKMQHVDQVTAFLGKLRSPRAAHHENDGVQAIMNALADKPMTSPTSPAHPTVTNEYVSNDKMHSAESGTFETAVTYGVSQKNQNGNMLSSEVLTKLANIYTELFTLLEPKPLTFKDFWVTVFQMISDIQPKDRKNLSSIFFHQLSEIVVSIRCTFFSVFHEYQLPLALKESFKRYDLGCRDKDYKILHVDYAFSKQLAQLYSLISKEQSPELQMSMLTSSLRLLKKMEAKPDDWSILNLLLPLIHFVENAKSGNESEIVRWVWDNQKELGKSVQNSKKIEYIWKFLLLQCVIKIIAIVKEKVITEEEKSELTEFILALHQTDENATDLETLLKQFKNVRANIKKYYEDKPPSLSVPVQVVQVPQAL